MKPYIGTKSIFAEPQQSAGGFDGYKVAYPDGYTSWSPAPQFEAAYQEDGKLSFGHALVILKEGGRVARTGWNGKGMWLECQFPDAGSKMTRPYIYIKTADGGLVPWLASQADMLEDDWTVLIGWPSVQGAVLSGEASHG